MTVPLDGCPMAGEANTVAMTTATRPHGNEHPTRIFDSLIGNNRQSPQRIVWYTRLP
jgi:hypothetical protein